MSVWQKNRKKEEYFFHVKKENYVAIKKKDRKLGNWECEYVRDEEGRCLRYWE